MCGIAGIISTGLIQDQIRLMTNSLAHRGPDGEGHWISPSHNVALGHRRLAIIDLSTSASQPFQYDNGRFTVVFNGEIYNYVEIRKSLVDQGYRFRTASDTEVLAASFHNKGIDCLSDLDGMFAFAVWDEKTQTLFCARDRFGEKPFFFAFHEKSFYFASEMKALWKVGVPQSVDSKMIYQFLASGKTFDDSNKSRTFFSNIFKLQASHYMVIKIGDVSVEQRNYWKIADKPAASGMDLNESAVIVRNLLMDSLRKRMRSDVALGSSLSGGLDSSIIVCAMKLIGGPEFHGSTFSARFPGFSRDEGRFIDAVNEATASLAHAVIPSSDELFDCFDRLMYHQEEPFGSASIFAQYKVMECAKDKGVVVLLDGQGADELFAGYHHYQMAFLKEMQEKDLALYRLEKAALKSQQTKSVFNGLRSLVRNLSPVQVRAVLRSLRDDFIHSRIFHSDFYADNQTNDEKFRVFSTLRESLMQSTFGGYLEELLRFADRNSMAHSRELRLPFLSHYLAEFAFELPPTDKIKRGSFKYVLRQAFSDIVPHSIISRRDKIGYETPQDAWLCHPKFCDRYHGAVDRLVKDKILSPTFTRRVKGYESRSLEWRILVVDAFLSGANAHASAL